MNAATATPAPATGARGGWNRVANRPDRLIVHDALALIARVAIAAVFWLSGRTKVDGFLTVNETAFDLFRDEYKVPLLPPEVAAYIYLCRNVLPNPLGAWLVHALVCVFAADNDCSNRDIRLPARVADASDLGGVDAVLDRAWCRENLARPSDWHPLTEVCSSALLDPPRVGYACQSSQCPFVGHDASATDIPDATGASRALTERHARPITKGLRGGIRSDRIPQQVQP
jgi:hypothetical protein